MFTTYHQLLLDLNGQLLIQLRSKIQVLPSLSIKLIHHHLRHSIRITMTLEFSRFKTQKVLQDLMRSNMFILCSDHLRLKNMLLIFQLKSVILKALYQINMYSKLEVKVIIQNLSQKCHKKSIFMKIFQIAELILEMRVNRQHFLMKLLTLVNLKLDKLQIDLLFFTI